MNRVEIHDAPKQAVAEKLADLGLLAEPAQASAKFDFLIEGRIRLALRVAFPSTSKRRMNVGDKQYNYVYRAWNFNFHHRGKVGECYADFFACIPLSADGDLDLRRSFLIPWDSITGKTFYLPDSRRPYAGKLAAYRNAWDLLPAAVQALETQPAAGRDEDDSLVV